MKSADIVIIGGGVIGAAILHELSKYKLNVILLEKSEISAGSTGMSGGILRVYDDAQKTLEWAAESMQFYKNFNIETNKNSGFVRTGFLYLENSTNPHKMEKIVNFVNSRYGYKMEILTKKEGQKVYQTLNWDGIDFAIHEPDAGYAEPKLVTKSFIERSIELGSSVFERTPVKEICIKNNRVIGVKTYSETIHTETVIVATGAWTPSLLPYETPIRSKVIQVQMFTRFNANGIIPAFMDRTTALYGRPDRSGLYLIGLPVNKWDINPNEVFNVDTAYAQLVKKLAYRRFDWLRNETFFSGRRSFDGYTPDNKGLLSFSDNVQGLLIAAGWSGKGFKIAPAIASRVRKLIV